MTPTRIMSLLGLFVGLVIVLVAASCAASAVNDRDGGSSGDLRIRDPLTEALRYMPQSSAIVAEVKTDAGDGPLRSAFDLSKEVPGSGTLLKDAGEALSDLVGVPLSSQVQSLAGAPVVVAWTDAGLTAGATLSAWVALNAEGLTEVVQAKVGANAVRAARQYRRWTIYSATDVSYAQRDRVLLTASNARTLREAIDRRLKTGRGAGLSRAAFTAASRSGIAAGEALIRVAVNGRVLRGVISRRLPKVDQLPWVAALQGAGLAVSTDEDGVHLKARLQTDEVSLTEPDLPVAPGTKGPEVNGEAPVVVGVRNVAQSIDVLLQAAQIVAPERVKAYTKVRDRLARVARVDIERDLLGALTDDATVSFPATGGVTLRAQSPDEGRLRGVLERLGGTGRPAGLAGSPPGSPGVGPELSGFAVREEEDGRYTILQDEEPIAVVALRDGILVASTDALTDVDSVLSAPTQIKGTAPGSSGALRATLSETALGDVLVEFLGLEDIVNEGLEPFGDVTVTARSQLSYTTIGVDLELEQ